MGICIYLNTPNYICGRCKLGECRIILCESGAKHRLQKLQLNFPRFVPTSYDTAGFNQFALFKGWCLSALTLLNYVTTEDCLRLKTSCSSGTRGVWVRRDLRGGCGFKLCLVYINIKKEEAYLSVRY